MGFYTEKQQIVFIDYDSLLSNTVVDSTNSEELKTVIGAGFFKDQNVAKRGIAWTFADTLNSISSTGAGDFNVLAISSDYGLDDMFKKEIKAQKFLFMFNNNLHIDIEVTENYSFYDNAINILISSDDDRLNSWVGPKIKFVDEKQAFDEFKKHIPILFNR